MIELYMGMAIVAFTIIGIVAVSALGRIESWLETIADREQQIITQNAQMNEKMNTLLNGDFEGLEFVNMSHPRGDKA